MAASVKILLATWNTTNLYEENNLETYDTEHYACYDTAVPEYQIIQPYENEVLRHVSYNDPMTWESYNTEIPICGELGERMYQEEIKNHTIEQLTTEINQAEQNVNSVMEQSANEYGKQVDELINEQKTAEMDTSVANLKEIPMQGPTKEHKSYDMLEHAYNLAFLQSDNDSPYEYSNSTFLFNFLHFPSPLITADSIRMRFGGRFLSFLSSKQVIRVLIVLLENKLELSNEDQKEFIETIFGHIDYSLELVITKELVVMLVEAMMKSNVPDYFEQVYLTWKIWYSFTIEEQEKMLKYVKRKYKREILVMLYLFVVNRDEDNSQQCEIFKNDIKNQYEKTSILKNGHSIKDIIIMENEPRKIEAFYIILGTFDICLLDLPEVFKCLDKRIVIAFRDYFRESFFTRKKITKYYVLNYKSHVCYAFSKFTQEFVQINDIGKSNDVETNSQLYFDLENIKYGFENWMKMLRGSISSDIETFSNEYKKEFVNAFAILRQVTQSNEYNCDIFFEILNKVCTTSYFDRPYPTILFSLTNENILRDLIKTQKWNKYARKNLAVPRKYQFIEDIFIKNASSNFTKRLKYIERICVIKMSEVLSKLNTKKSIIMYREHYFYQHFLFHPRFEMFNGMTMSNYIESLSKIGLLHNEEQCDQIARDLVFSEYYCKAAIEFNNTLMGIKGWTELEKFKKSIKKELGICKNIEVIEKEREMFKRC
ncbi:hypothetical protein PAEPH01_0656 [Pancytospora epiphaga]|nr:hypothetical protein PAEPH01_0656 [Pancytospora epiphaga]